MKTSQFFASTSREYRRLEGISRPSIINIALRNFWQFIVLNLTRGSEIQVWKIKTRAGSAWRVYDPHTNLVMNFHSESEVRSWIEARYSS